jgi:tryptophan 2,3-dioxygenase
VSDEDVQKIELPADDRITYGSYLKVNSLLTLQELESKPEMHDELLFIIIHQAYELWFKQILFELDTVVERLDLDDIYEARRLMMRVIQIEKLLVEQIHILETMTPRDFASFRSVLNPASGFQSVQFREVEFVSGIKKAGVMKGIRLTDEERVRLERRLEQPSIRDRLYAALQRRGFDVVTPGPDGELSEEDRERTLKGLLQIYRSPENYFHLYNLCEAAVEHDQWILMWRFHHVRVVERLIGTKRGTGGSMGVKYLASTLEKRAFPLIWQVRGLLEDNDFYGKERGITKPDDECG